MRSCWLFRMILFVVFLWLFSLFYIVFDLFCCWRVNLYWRLVKLIFSMILLFFYYRFRCKESGRVIKDDDGWEMKYFCNFYGLDGTSVECARILWIWVVMRWEVRKIRFENGLIKGGFWWVLLWIYDILSDKGEKGYRSDFMRYLLRIRGIWIFW